MKLYQHSGKVGYSPILLAAVGVPLIIVLSCIYAYITVYSPIAGYVTLLILVGYIFANGLLLAYLAKLGKCRNKMFLTVSGVVGGLLGVYFSWLFFLYALLHTVGYDDVGFFDIMLNPAAMWFSIQSINETGWYTLKSLTPSGIMLWIFWAIEAVAIVVGVWMLNTYSIDEEMFCEKCNAWSDIAETRFFKMPPQFGASKAEDINPLMLTNLEVEDNLAQPFIKGEMLKCNNCVNYSGWRYKVISSEIDKDGNEKPKSDAIPGIVLAS